MLQSGNCRAPEYFNAYSQIASLQGFAVHPKRPPGSCRDHARAELLIIFFYSHSSLFLFAHSISVRGSERRSCQDMENKKDRLYELLSKQLAGEASKAELEEMLRLMAGPDSESALEELIQDYRSKSPESADHPGNWEKIWAGIRGKLQSSQAPVRSLKWWYLAAASILLCTGFFLFNNINSRPATEFAEKIHSNPMPVNDRLPGTSKAILTLSDGRKIELNKDQNGSIARDGSSEIINRDGSISYSANEHSAGVNAINTISTPRGGQYKLVLPDGTKVWLNAASSIRYPLVFAPGERRVEVSGELYFEVESNREKPFIVSVSEGPELKVLGTSFNVNAYSPEKNLITLLEGSVQLITKQNKTILKPGQQASTNENQELEISDEVLLDEVVAWKNGFFRFNSTDIKTMMEQAVRWYDIEVEYPGGIPSDRFSGTISRNVNLSQFLKILEYSELEISISGSKLSIR